MKEQNNRNRVTQIIINKDGTKKKIHHEKKFNAPEYGDRKAWWLRVNMMPKKEKKLENS